MLVLNTNEQGSSGNVLSNSMIRAYPDFKSLLFYPNLNGSLLLTGRGTTSIYNGETKVNILTNVKAFEVNGTIVSVSNQILDEKTLLMGLDNGGNLGSDNNRLASQYGYMYFQKNSSSATSYNGACYHVINLGFAEQFQDSGIVGKRIIFNCGFVASLEGSVNTFPSGTTRKFFPVYRLGLLHSDGTITYGDWCEEEALKTADYTNATTTTYYTGYSNKCVESETDGLNYVAGDRLIIQLGVGCRVIWSGSAGSAYQFQTSGFFRYIYFGVRGTPNDYVKEDNYWGTTNISSTYATSNMRGRPIQISIE